MRRPGMRSGVIGEYDDAGSGDADKDLHTLEVAGYGVNPTPAPRFALSHPRHGRDDGGESGWRDTLVWFGVPVIVVLLVRLFLFGFYSIPSGSMMGTIEVGDRVITNKLAPRIVPVHRGDVIVFRDPANWLADEQSSRNNDLIKRLIGMPGDVVACQGAGHPVTINGVEIDERTYIRPGVDPSNFAFNVTVTPGHVFVMGDNRSNSADSRYHQDDGDQGLVPMNDVLGVAMVTYWPFDRIGRLDAHHEVFRNVPDRNGKLQ
ncbi:signal peptidase I [Bifidobacterium mongoliense]|uniref:signal peptidase I n=1 Tax=Bifidobacterium mongoliense TaxID=518643 RepID=UPI00389AA9DC